MLTARAKKIDSNEDVEGAFDGEYRILTKYDSTRFHRGKSVVCYKSEIIDPDTLKYSFDGGKNFYSESEIQETFTKVNNLLAWAKSNYHRQVLHRPESNVFKQTLHNVWMQIINKLSGVK